MWKAKQNADGSNDKWTVRGWIEAGLMVSGLALLAFFGAAHLERLISSRAALKAFESLDTAVASPAGVAAHESAPVLDFSLWDEARVRAYRQGPSAHVGAPLAVLEISKIHLVAPVLNGTDDLTLNHGVGRVEGTARPGERGNIGIAGHRDSFFRGLKEVRAGDAIELRTYTGSDTYIIDQTQIVMPWDVEVLRPRSVPSVTLVTCYPFYFIGSAPKRFVVTAHFAESRAAGPTTSESRLPQQSRTSTMEEQ
jgi:sortase A